MTPSEIDRLLAAAHQPPLAEGADPSDALDRVESLAEAEPANPHVSAAFEALYRRVSLEAGLPQVVGGVRRERLVRWDAFTSTWTGTRVEDSCAVLVRTVDAHADARRRRQLSRLARSLGRDARDGVLVAELPGLPLGPARAADPALARRVVTGLLAIEAHGGCPTLAPEELREVGDDVVLVCLTGGGDGSEGVAALAATLVPAGEGPLHDLLHGLHQLPVTPDAVSALVAKALGRELAGMRHHLLARWSASGHSVRTARLAATVQRLIDALPPPRGRAAAGVDMEGQVLAVASDEDQVRFGPELSMVRVWSTEEGLDAPVARQLLRAQAAAPPNPRLSKQVGGDSAFNGAIGRWVAASLRLRTLSMLLASQRST